MLVLWCQQISEEATACSNGAVLTPEEEKNKGQIIRFPIVSCTENMYDPWEQMQDLFFFVGSFYFLYIVTIVRMPISLDVLLAVFKRLPSS